MMGVKIIFTLTPLCKCLDEEKTSSENEQLPTLKYKRVAYITNNVNIGVLSISHNK